MTGLAYRREIDGLRAVAVLSVVLYHADAALAPGGFVGVDVFFVISGYLITSLLRNEWLANGRLDLSAFYARRVRRLVPALAVVVLATLALGAWLLPPIDVQMARLAASAVASMVFVANLYFAVRSGGYFDGPAEEMPLLHLWSLGVEEQFYLVYPVLLLVLFRFAGRHRGRVLVLLSLASLLACEWWLQFDPKMAFYQMPSRFWEFALGALVALHLPASLRKPVPELLSLSGLALLLASVWWIPPGLSFPGIGAAPAVLGSVLLLAGVHSGTGEGPVARILGCGPMVFVGLISYSLYLWHWPLLALDQAVGLEPSALPVRLGLCAVAVLLAWASYRLVEAPFRRPGPTPPPARHVLWAGAVVSGMVIAAAIATAALPRAGGEAGELASRTRSDRPENMDRCHYGPQQVIDRLKPDDCQSAPGRPLRVAIWGDSHALAWQPFAWELAKMRGESAIGMTLDGCPPVQDYQGTWAAWPEHGRNCRALNALALERLGGGGFDTVILAARWPGHFGTRADRTTDDPSRMPDPAIDAFKAGLEATVAGLEGKVRQVVILAPLPQLRYGAPECIATGRLPKCAMPRADYDRSASLPMAFFHELAARHPQVLVLDTAAFFCGDDVCPVVKDGYGLYWDDDHVSSTAARKFAIERMRALPALAGSPGTR